MAFSNYSLVTVVYTKIMLTFTLPVVFTSLVLLLVRLILTVTFFAEARHKLHDIKVFAKSDGLPVSVAYIVALCELAASLGMLTGVLAQWAGIGLMLLMLSTIGLHIFKWKSPYRASKHGWEYDLLMLALAAVIFTFGAGQISLMI